MTPVSWAVPGAVPKEVSTAGKAGTYISVAAGPTAMKYPRRSGSLAGVREGRIGA